MKAIILAAGQGTRLKKYTDNLPKGMLMFNGKTIIERQIELYQACGIEKIIIVKGFAAEKIQYKNIKYYTNANYETTNMVDSLMTAQNDFDDDIIVSYSDILFSKDMLLRMINCPEDYAVAVDIEWKRYWMARYGKVDFDTESLRIDAEDNIIELGLESPSIEKIDARYVGLLKFSLHGLNQIVEKLNHDYIEYGNDPWKQSGNPIHKSYMTDLLQALIDDNQKIKAEKFCNGWIEFDTNEDYEKACVWLDTGYIENFLSLK